MPLPAQLAELWAMLNVAQAVERQVHPWEVAAIGCSDHVPLLDLTQPLQPAYEQPH
jgi:hypothetical protein